MIKTKVKVFCEIYTQTLEQKINTWVAIDEAGVIHWNCMQLTTLVQFVDGNQCSAFGVIIPYEPKDQS